MPWDFAFDPVTEDLIDDGVGGVELTDNASTMVQHQFACHLGECWQDPSIGSRLHDLRAFGPNPEVSLVDEVTRALKVVAARGRIDSIEVASQRISPTRVDVVARFRDTSTGQHVAQVIKAGSK